jgi:disulfide bond formation protein DsbB
MTPAHSCRYIGKLFTMPNTARFILAAALAALLFAFTVQYDFGVQPCILCLWQRVPYGLVILLAGLACLPAMRPHAPVMLVLCAGIFVIGAGLAIFHTGVELHWWLGTSGCALTPLHGSTPEDLRTQLLHTVVARCDEISWTFLGLSMANWNVGYSLILALFSFCAAKKAAA